MQTTKRQQSQPFPFHMLFTAALPVLGLYLLHVHSTAPGELVLHGVAMLLAAFSAWVVFAVVTGNAMKAGFIVSLGLFIFFGYSALWEAVALVQVEGFDFHREEYPLGLAALLFVVGSCIILALPQVVGLTRLANVCSLMLVVAAVVGIFYRTNKEETPRRHLEGVPVSSDMLSPPSSLPDIYYVVLEGYSRADTLEDVYGLDISEFVTDLKTQGFYVAEGSTTNYAEAAHNLTASLNLTYLDSIASSTDKATLPAWVPAAFRGQAHFNVLTENLQENHLFPLLRRLGYSIVGLPTGWTPTEHVPVDHRLRGPAGWSEFQTGLLNLTPLRTLLDMVGEFNPLEDHRIRVNYVFDSIPQLAAPSESDSSPKFVFAHLRCPRYPFTFNKNGGRQPASRRGFSWSGVSEESGSSVMDLPGYASQMEYVNTRVKAMVTHILSRSKNPPIIVLQGGHGPSAECDPQTPDSTCFKERFPIFNAFYLPQNGSEALYPSISPVNTFRVILNQYFGAQLRILEDRNYWSTAAEPLRFEDVTERVQPKVEVEVQTMEKPGVDAQTTDTKEHTKS